jgi:hypothetical protein
VCVELPKAKRDLNLKRIIRITLLALLAVSSASAEQFHKVAYYNVGYRNFPFQVITADFRNNGNTDLAVADYLSGRVSILLGNGDGTFRPLLSFAVPAAFALATGDFDGDGKADLAVVESDGATNGLLDIYLGNGDGTFHKSGDYQTGASTASIAVADFNGDGFLDVAVANKGFDKPGSVMVFFGTGKGTLKKPATYKMLGGPYGIAAADLNGDHHPDLAVAEDTGGSVAVLINDGTGKFLKPVVYSVGGGEAVDVKIADLRHDGRNDLAVVNASLSSIEVLLNNGDGTFGAAKSYPTSLPGESTGADGVAIADFNLDGKLDLAASNQDGNSALLYGKGDGTFKAAVPIHDEIKFDGASGLTAGDFNNDKAPDLAFAMYFKNKIAIMINTR